MKKIEKLKPYIVEFFEYGIMKPKVYFSNFAIRDENYQWNIVITYDKCTFFENNRIQNACAQKREIFLDFKNGVRELCFQSLFFYLDILV